MKPFYNSTRRYANLEDRARAWVGTPYAENAAVLQVGVSCANLVSSIYTETGFNLAAPIPDAPTHWAHSNPYSHVLAYLERPEVAAQFPLVTDGSLWPGDLIGVKTEAAIHHTLLVLLFSRFIHSLPAHGAIIERIDDPRWAAYEYKVWRPHADH